MLFGVRADGEEVVVAVTVRGEDVRYHEVRVVIEARLRIGLRDRSSTTEQVSDG